MVFNGYKMVSTAYLLGIYNTTEERWNFIEVKQLANTMIGSVLPNFKTELKIPKGIVNTEKIKS